MTYNKRTWLNNTKSDSTSTIVAYDGYVTYKNKPTPYRFLEISDCKNKIRLHQNTDDTKSDYVNKIKLLRDELTKYILFLQNEI